MRALRIVVTLTLLFALFVSVCSAPTPPSSTQVLPTVSRESPLFPTHAPAFVTAALLSPSDELDDDKRESLPLTLRRRKRKKKKKGKRKKEKNRPRKKRKKQKRGKRKKPSRKKAPRRNHRKKKPTKKKSPRRNSRRKKTRGKRPPRRTHRRKRPHRKRPSRKTRPRRKTFGRKRPSRKKPQRKPNRRRPPRKRSPRRKRPSRKRPQRKPNRRRPPRKRPPRRKRPTRKRPQRKPNRRPTPKKSPRRNNERKKPPRRSFPRWKSPLSNNRPKKLPRWKPKPPRLNDRRKKLPRSKPKPPRLNNRRKKLPRWKPKPPRLNNRRKKLPRWKPKPPRLNNWRKKLPRKSDGKKNPERRDDGRNKPPRKSDGRMNPEHRSDGGHKPPSESIGRKNPEHRSDGGHKPPSESIGRKNPEHRSDGGQKPPSESIGRKNPELRSDGGHKPPSESIGRKNPEHRSDGRNMPPRRDSGRGKAPRRDDEQTKLTHKHYGRGKPPRMTDGQMKPPRKKPLHTDNRRKPPRTRRGKPSGKRNGRNKPPRKKPSRRDNRRLPRTNPLRKGLQQKKKLLEKSTSWVFQSMPTGVKPGHWKPTLLMRRCLRNRKKCPYNCSGKTFKEKKCTFHLRVPKMCQRRILENYPCPGQSTSCTKRSLVAATCMKKVTGETTCSRKRNRRVCKDKKAKLVGCAPNPCEAIREERCGQSTKRIKQPCSTRGKCEKCNDKLLLSECSRQVIRKLPVRCPATPQPKYAPHQKPRALPSESPLPAASLVPQLLSIFEDIAPFTEVVRCYASAFLEHECKEVPPVCEVFNRRFDIKLCETEVCNDCRRMKWLPVSDKLAEYCEHLLHSKCEKYGSIRLLVGSGAVGDGGWTRAVRNKVDLETSIANVGSKLIREHGRCFRVKTLRVTVACPKRLRRDHMCQNGCARKTCERQVLTKMSNRECNALMPRRCRGKRGCVKQYKTKRVCDEKPVVKVCRFEVQQPYACEKREGPLDCPNDKKTKWCHRSVTQEYACGVKSVKRQAPCSMSECELTS